MAKARIYPKADARTQWWETAFTRGTFTGIEKILLHTTETTGWPGYASGSMAPTLTYHPRSRAWRQHNYLDRSARALVDPSGTAVRENRDNVIQIEIVAYADEAKGRSVGGLVVSEFTDDMLRDLADFIQWVRAEWGGPPLVAAKFLPYPSSYGNSSVRMSGPEYDAFRGVLGHMHASGNNHGDPGALNVARIMQLAAPTTTAPAPVPEEDDMAMTPAERAALIADIRDSIINAPLPNHDTNPDDDKPAGTSLLRSNVVMANWRASQLQGAVASLAGQVAGLGKALEQIAAGQGIDLGAIQAAAKAGASAALDERISSADVTLTVDPA